MRAAYHVLTTNRYPIPNQLILCVIFHVPLPAVFYTLPIFYATQLFFLRLNYEIVDNVYAHFRARTASCGSSYLNDFARVVVFVHPYSDNLLQYPAFFHVAMDATYPTQQIVVLTLCADYP